MLDISVAWLESKVTKPRTVSSEVNTFEGCSLTSRWILIIDGILRLDKRGILRQYWKDRLVISIDHYMPHIVRWLFADAPMQCIAVIGMVWSDLVLVWSRPPSLGLV
jgi:hypothetical protein